MNRYGDLTGKTTQIQKNNQENRIGLTNGGEKINGQDQADIPVIKESRSKLFKLTIQIATHRQIF